MTQQPKHFEITNAIDLHLSDDGFNAVARNSANKYQPWYATLLNAVALLVAQEEVVHAHTDYESTMVNAKQLVVFTTNCLFSRHDPILVFQGQQPPRKPFNRSVTTRWVFDVVIGQPGRRRGAQQRRRSRQSRRSRS